MENNFWGVKSSFGIEIGNFDREKRKGKIRFWLEGEVFGDFKKSLKLSYAIDGIKRLSSSEDLYDNSFEDKNEEEIFTQCLFLDKDPSEFTSDDYEKVNRYQKFSFYFGDQLDNVANVIFRKGDNYHFIWSMNNDYSGKKINYLKNLRYAKVPIVNLQSVASSFLFWIEN